MGINISGSLNADALATYADLSADESIREDLKSDRARRTTAMDNHITSAKDSIDANKKAADERLAASKKKSNGGLWGSIIGIVLCVVCIVLACTGVGAPLAAGLLALGAACLGAGGSVGNSVGSKNAEGAEKRADEFKQVADEKQLDEKTFDKTQEDLRDQIRANQDSLKQLWEQAKQREQAENRITLG